MDYCIISYYSYMVMVKIFVLAWKFSQIWGKCLIVCICNLMSWLTLYLSKVSYQFPIQKVELLEIFTFNLYTEKIGKMQSNICNVYIFQYNYDCER